MMARTFVCPLPQCLSISTSLTHSPLLKYKYYNSNSTFTPLISPPILSKHPLPKLRSLRTSVASEDAAVSAAEILSSSTTTGDDGVSNIISILLFVAFIGLSILTIGVIYIAVTDFLQKREKEKFEKEEASKKDKGGKKVRVRARAGPRGFGQKINEEEDD